MSEQSISDLRRRMLEDMAVRKFRREDATRLYPPRRDLRQLPRPLAGHGNSPSDRRRCGAARPRPAEYSGVSRQAASAQGEAELVEDEFLKQGEPLVRDETIAGYDKRSEELVVRITGGGTQGETAITAPDCGVLKSLLADLKLLVETQQAKWTHMLGKVDQELGK